MNSSLTADPTQHTAGPWGWFGGPHGFYLATLNRGRRYVMGFERYGMRAGQPTFQVDGCMVPGKDLALFEVGDPSVVGFDAARKAGSGVYREDVIGFAHPDARLIAAAPDLHEALGFVLRTLKAQFPKAEYEAMEVVQIADKALEKARG